MVLGKSEALTSPVVREGGASYTELSAECEEERAGGHSCNAKRWPWVVRRGEIGRSLEGALGTQGQWRMKEGVSSQGAREAEPPGSPSPNTIRRGHKITRVPSVHDVGGRKEFRSEG